MKIYQTILALFCLVAISASCKDDSEEGGLMEQTLEVSAEQVVLADEAGSSTLQVTTKGNWKATVEEGADWISLSPDGGKGNSGLRIMAEQNTREESRTGKVSVALENSTIKREVSVEQLGVGPNILIGYDAEEIPASGGEWEISVVANVDWTVEIEEAYSSWITLIDKGEGSCRVLVAANADVQRVGRVNIKSTGVYHITKVAEFTQAFSEAHLAIEQDEYILPYKNQVLTIPVDLGGYNTRCRISCDDDWVIWDEDASSSTGIVLKLADNDASDFPRVTEVTITNVYLQEKVTIFQYGKPNPRIGDDTNGAVLAFPGAEGGGRFTTGGRGGEIYRVTNLEDYAAGTPIQGSLRYGIEKSSQPRIIIFDVSGIIRLKKGLFLADHPNLSILGQTAPGDGITLQGYNFSFNLSQQSKEMNAILRFLRCRPGDEHSDYAEDAIGGRYFTNAIIDHISSSWGVDETLSFYGCQNFTAQWCTSTESLNFSNHAKGAHGYGSMFSGDNASYHHILMAHHGSRVPRISDMPEPGTQGPGDHIGFFDVRNNVYYNWSEAGFGAYGGKHGTFNMVNNYYKAGPATGTGSMSWRVLSSDPTARAYIEGNYVTARPEVTADNWPEGIWTQFWRDLHPTEAEMQAMRLSEPQPFSKVTTHAPEDAYERVLKYAGASLRKDAVDLRIEQEVRTKTSTFIGSRDERPRPGIIDTVDDTDGYPAIKSLKALADADGDGIPDIWEDAYGLDKNNPADALGFNLDPMSRYSNLEVYFHNLVQHIVYEQNLGGVQEEKK